MVTPPDIEAQILRLYHAEKWTMGTIARQLHIHHSVVRRVLAQAGLPRTGPPPAPGRREAGPAVRWRWSGSIRSGRTTAGLGGDRGGAGTPGGRVAGSDDRTSDSA